MITDNITFLILILLGTIHGAIIVAFIYFIFKKIKRRQLVIQEMLQNQIIKTEFPNLKLYNTEETLDKIKQIILNKKKGAYLRFGDGDILLAHGIKDLYQIPNLELQSEMQETLQLNDTNILKTLPLQCPELKSLEKGMYPGNGSRPYERCFELLTKARPFWGEVTDVYSPMALIFAATSRVSECINFLKFLKQSNCAILIGNKNIPQELIELLFGKNCHFIPTPSSNSYSSINQIEIAAIQNLNKNNDYKIVVISMGCSGRPLAKRLWKKVDNIFIFDFGSLMDALCGQDTRYWHKHMDFNYFKKFREQLKKELC
ncbi:MAG: hypothetical protein UR26_C0001G0133 [candidate division TM6 bacterium GW2011_GWF2_32_72]|nr:MAG: hypothetical protein UR26_C0001G0133 [candidate division TM6 bacterium GW2011_GWF2_32_72]